MIECRPEAMSLELGSPVMALVVFTSLSEPLALSMEKTSRLV
jgi:hypothetical protein